LLAANLCTLNFFPQRRSAVINLNIQTPTVKKLLAFTIIAIGFAAGASAQRIASANASGVVLSPMGIAIGSGMEFGSFLAGSEEGTVTIPSNGGIRTSKGGVSFPMIGTPARPAEITITGEPLVLYDIQFPSQVSIYNSNKDSIAVNKFSYNSDSQSRLIDGRQVLKIGATVNVRAAQRSGVYAAPVKITVNYY